MKKYFLLLLLFIPFVVYGQSSFVINGFGENFKDDDKIYLIYKDSSGVIIDSCNVIDKKFQFTGQINGITRASLHRNENPLKIEIAYDVTSFYLEEGEIIISAKNSLNDKKLSGTKTNIDLEELNNLTADLNRQSFDINVAFDALDSIQKNNLKVIHDRKEKIKSISNHLLPIQLKFISEHPNSYISLVTLDKLSKNTEYIVQVEDAFSKLNTDLKLIPLGLTLEKQIKALINSDLGTKIIDFSQPNTKDEQVKLSSYNGKYILIDFWASWCLPCRKENPNLLNSYYQYVEKGFTIISISLDDDKKAWLKAIEQDKLPWLQLSDLKGSKNEAALKFGISTIPANILINPAGEIISKNLTGINLQNKLSEIFK